MKAAQWLRRGVKQLQRKADHIPAAQQHPEAARWLAPELLAPPVPETDSTLLRGWLQEVSAAAVVVQAEAPEAEVTYWFGRRLAELEPHLAYVQHSDPDQFGVLQEFVSAVLKQSAGQQALYTLVGIHKRVLLWLTAGGRRGDVLVVLADLQDNGPSYRIDRKSVV